MNNFKGWSTVFQFTFKQTAKTMAYKLVTAFVALFLVAGISLIVILGAKPDKDTGPLPVKEVYVLDESGLEPVDYQAMMPQVTGKNYKDIKDITYHNLTDITEKELVLTAASKSKKAMAVHIYPEEKGYTMEVLLPEKTTISKGNAKKLLDPMVSCFNMHKLTLAGLSEQQLTQAIQPVVTSYTEVGEDNSIVKILIKMLAPMMFGLVLYLMLILYGQNICKEVSTEKTSKLMETLLTSVHPYAMLTGKILAITTTALMQFGIWIIASITAVVGSNMITRMMYPSNSSSAIQMISFLRKNMGESAFSLPAIILAMIIFCIGFLFYCVIAGLAGSMVSKPEEAASMQMVFTFPIIISWLVCYLAPIMENDRLITVIRYIPFTVPFCVPVELLTGAVGLLQGLLSALILLAFSLLVIMLSARIYKGLVLYNGQKLNLKTIVNILKAER